MTDVLATSIDRFRGIEPGPDAVAAALASHRQRMLALVRTFDDTQWQARSRCSEWTVHDVVRHLADVAEMDIALQRGDGPRNPDGHIDPRNDPDAWLEASRGQTPAETVAAFEAAADAEQVALQHRIRDGGGELLPGPYGPLHWASLAAHLYWDAWLHERDIVVALGLRHGSTVVEDRLAALYGLMIAAYAPTVAGATVKLSVELRGSTTDVFEVDASPDGASACVLDGADGPAMIRAETGALLDALSGRGPDVADVVEGPSDIVEPLTMLRAFFLSTA